MPGLLPHLQRNRGLLAALAILAGGVTLHLLGSPRFGLDDAYISYRFAENWVQGQGLVFNPGERVEGYSNFLHVALIALGRLAIAGDSIHFWSVFLNTLFMAGAITALHRELRHRYGAAPATVAALLFASAPPVWKVVNDGLATSLVVLLQVALWIFAERARRNEEGLSRGDEIWLWTTIGALVLTRADGFVMPVIAIVYLLLLGRSRLALRSTAVLTAVFALCTLARLLYYGYPLPNTVYVKVSLGLAERLGFALDYLDRFLLDSALLPYAIILGSSAAISLGLVARRQVNWRSALMPEVFLAFGWLAYLVFVGGDVLGIRWLLILLPLGIAAGVRLQARLGARQGVLVAAVLILLAFHSRPFWSFEQRFPFVKRDGWRTIGLTLREAHPNALIAVDAAGLVPYFSKLPTIDMLGLNDSHIAHQTPKKAILGHGKFDADYVLGREPDLIGAWMSADLDLFWGLDRARYEAAGYRIRYLVAPIKHPAEESVVDARGLKDPELKRLHGRYFNWAVLERRRLDAEGP